MKRIENAILTMNSAELDEIAKALERGHIETLINRRKQQFDKRKQCPVCNNSVGEGGYTLQFGPADLRKQATFDGLDCLEFFLSGLKK